MAYHINSHNEEKLKIGLIVDSIIASKYEYDLAFWGQSQENLAISHLIIQVIPSIKKNLFQRAISSFKKNGLLHLLQNYLFKFINKMEAIKLKRSQIYRNHFDRFNLKDVVKNEILVNPIISKSGFVYRYSEFDLTRIREENFDVLIRCGSGILRGDILNSSKFGIISFHHADNRINRGWPAGFWEVYFKQDSTGFIIQQLTNELDGGNVLFRGAFSTQYYYLYNQAALFEKANFYMKKILSDIAISRALPSFDKSFPYFNPLLKLPNIVQQIKYKYDVLLRVLERIFNKYIAKKCYSWGVAFAKGGWENLVMWRGIKIKNPPNHFLADPFLISNGDETYCFVENYDHLKSKGCISVYKLNENSYKLVGDAIVEPFHVSFPYIFNYQSKIFMCPETLANNDIRIYECDEFPLKWSLKKILMSNISTADTMIFEKDGLWWLFTNIDPLNVDSHCSTLYIYYSENPLSDSWESHPKNPIMVDSLRGRNAGILFDENFIYRVSQKQGFNGEYGKASLINQIITLSKTDYHEQTIITIEPNFFNNLKGTHHLHSNGNFTVFDFCELTKSNL